MPRKCSNIMLATLSTVDGACLPFYRSLYRRRFTNWELWCWDRFSETNEGKTLEIQRTTGKIQAWPKQTREWIWSDAQPTSLRVIDSDNSSELLYSGEEWIFIRYKFRNGATNKSARIRGYIWIWKRNLPKARNVKAEVIFVGRRGQLCFSTAEQVDSAIFIYKPQVNKR